jgi:hypothetical protein
MRRWLAVATGALVLAAVFHSSVGVQAATKTATGTVSAVSADSLTVKGKEAGKDVEWTFHVDTKTTVIGKGAGTKAKDIKDEKKSPQIVDFVKTGDPVTVKYDDVTKHASEVRLAKAQPK